MCIIVYNKACRRVNREMLHTAYENNPHGFGFMWFDPESKIVRTKKFPYGKYEQLEREVTTFEKKIRLPYFLHLRWRTRGKISHAQSHPHRVFDRNNGDPYDLWMMHNGTFSGFVNDGERSDTKQFSKKLRSALLFNGHDFDTSLAEMKSHINHFDKVVFLNNRGEVVFVNESAGEWLGEGDVWVSNTYSFEKDYRKKDTSPFFPPAGFPTRGVYVARGTGTIKAPNYELDEETGQIRNNQWYQSPVKKLSKKERKRLRKAAKSESAAGQGSGTHGATYRVRSKDGTERTVEVKIRY